MGEEADDIVVSFGLTADETKQYEVVKNRFENHFVVKRNVIFEQAKFNLKRTVNLSTASLLICTVSQSTVNLAPLKTTLSGIE